MRWLYILALLPFGAFSQTQSIISSVAGVRTCLNNTECSSSRSASYLFYDEAKNAFYLKLDFTALRTGVDSMDTWLDDLKGKYLYLKAILRKEEFPMLSNSNAKTYALNAQVYMNEVWEAQPIELSIFTTENSHLNYGQTVSNYNNYKVSFGFSLDPKTFKLDTMPHKLTETIFISIGLGFINELEPGMEKFVKEAYDH
ncbi:MAG: hypothetical protein MUF75_12520 [Bacteroidia bacterium]|nr:hypothetical protein [Bacteroidia bacterium]